MVGLCRLCASLKKADLLINIKDESNEICQKLKKCCRVSLQMCDAMPKSVCHLCLEQLNVSYNFYSKVQEAQETLKAIFPSNQPDKTNADALVPWDDSPPKDTPTRCISKQSTLMETAEIIDPARRRKMSLSKIKAENGDVETQETLKVLYPGEQKSGKCNDNLHGSGDESPVKDRPSSNTAEQSVVVEMEDIIEPSKRKKKSHRKVKIEKGDKVEHARQASDTRHIVFAITDDVYETGDASNGDNDGYLQEVYSILGMTNDDAGVQGPTPEEHERMDFLVTNFGKQEQVHIIPQEDHFFPEEEEQHLMENEDLMEDEEGTCNISDINDRNVQIEEVVLDEKYAEEEIELDYEELEEESIGYRTNENIDTAISKSDTEDRRKNYSSLPPEMQLTSWHSYKHHCYDCDYRASSFKDLIKHADGIHSISDSNKLHYKCYDCKKVIGHYNDFLNHVRLKHHPALKLRCDACDLLCSDYKQYELHRDINCLEAKKFPTNLTCSYCCKTFRSSTGHQQHINQHLEGNPTAKFKCKECHKEFLSKTALAIHEKIHKTKPATFSCDQCEKLFVNKGALDVHLSTHTNKKLYRCNICQKDFKTHAYLEKHQLVHTDHRPFQCSYCPRLFRTKIEQTTHERVHTGEMPLQCTHCEKRFRFRSALSAHLKTHSGIRPHTCKYCSKQFNDRSNFKKHIRRKHPEEENNEIEISADVQ